MLCLRHLRDQYTWLSNHNIYTDAAKQTKHAQLVFKHAKMATSVLIRANAPHAASTNGNGKVNPFMLRVAKKRHYHIAEIFEAKEELEKYLKEKC